MPVLVSGVQYSGMWTLDQATNAIAAGTWPVAPEPIPVGSMWSVGANSQGQLGLSNGTAYSSPKQIGALTTWSIISTQRQSAAAIKTDGTLWTWGNNSWGQLATGGGGFGQYITSPRQVGALTNWATISAAQQFMLAVKTDGTLWGWGNNDSGQLGLNNTTYYYSPKQVGAGTTWSKVAVSYYASFAIKTDGTLWTWGRDSGGNSGLNLPSQYRSSPVQVGTGTTWSLISSYGGSNSGVAAIKTDGTLWVWGYNLNGQLGLGDTVSKSSPTQVGSGTNWFSVSVGTNFMVATKTDGTLWSWGQGGTGRLGLGNTTTYSSPKQIGALTNWKRASAAEGFAWAVKTDKTAWSWGSGGDGKLGQGNTVSYSSPKQVGALTSWLSVSCGYDFTFAVQQ